MTERKKMARSERAKQFMPFAALKGYSEALQRKEEEVTANFVDKTNPVEYNTFVEDFCGEDRD